MKNLNSIFKLSLIIGIFLIANNIQAQEQYAKTNSAEAVASQQTKYLAEALKLEGEQIKDLEQINLLYAKQIENLRKKASSDNSKTDIEALKRSHTNKIRSLLSSEKYQEYLALKKKEEEVEKKEN